MPPVAKFLLKLVKSLTLINNTKFNQNITIKVMCWNLTMSMSSRVPFMIDCQVNECAKIFGLKRICLFFSSRKRLSVITQNFKTQRVRRAEFHDTEFSDTEFFSGDSPMA